MWAEAAPGGTVNGFHVLTGHTMLVSKLQEYYSAVRTLEKARGSSLTKEAVNLIHCRLRSGLGPALYMLYRLFDVPPSSWGEYLDKRAMDTILKAVNDPQLRVLDDKLSFYERCKQDGIPTPEVLAVVGVKTSEDSSNRYLDSAESFAQFVREVPQQDFIFKTQFGSYGQGLYAVRLEDGYLVDLADGSRHEPGHFFSKLVGTKDRYLVQPRLVRCEALADVMPGQALGTVRLVTYVKKNGDVSVPYALVKLPVQGRVVDNFAHGENHNLVSGIDVASGTMMHAFGKKRGEHLLSKSRIHPETGAEVVGRPVPLWKETLDCCTRAMRCFPEFRTIGWDVGITDDGIYILEGNRSYDTDLIQVTLERGIRSDILELYRS